MNTIYIDILFLVNLAINTSLIMGVGYLLKLPCKTLKILLAASLGSVYSCLIFFGNFSALSSVLVKLGFAALIMLLSFGLCPVRAVIKRTCLFMLLTAVYGIVILGVMYFTDLGLHLGGVIRNGVFYFSVPTHYILLCSGAIYGALHFTEKFFKKATLRSFSRIKLARLGKTVELTALVDTGNMLKDPLTGRKVIIAEAKKLSPLFGFDIESLLSENFRPDSLPEGFRVIPFSSIGKKNGLLAAFVPDTVEIDSEKKDNIITAIFDGTLSKSGDYNALMGP